MITYCTYIRYITVKIKLYDFFYKWDMKKRTHRLYIEQNDGID